MVSGGSGITPFFSIIRELLFAGTVLKCQTPKLVLISSFKKATDLAMLDLLLPMSGTPLDLSNIDLQIKAYVTREKGSQGEDKQPRSIWFKPNARDAPISRSLGQNCWLWLGAIISSSFIAFLLVMGILTQYYIYPIDKNTNDIFSTATRAVLYSLILCICIALTASGAVLWNKKSNAMETKQIINMEGITPKATPESRFYNADRELESFPHQSLLQSTEVFYGERPDIKSKTTYILGVTFYYILTDLVYVLCELIRHVNFVKSDMV